MVRKRPFSNAAIPMLLVPLLCGCGLPRQRFVDEEGRPLHGVLVMSSKPGEKLAFLSFLDGPNSSASITDARGWATVADRRNFVASLPGHHVSDQVREDLEQRRARLRGDGNVTVMHRRTGDPLPLVNDSFVHWDDVTLAEEPQLVPLPPEMGVTLEIVDREGFRARTTTAQLLPSARFYFAGPGEGPWVNSLEQQGGLYFYVRTEAGRWFKVGVTRSPWLSSWRKEIQGVSQEVSVTSAQLLWADLGQAPARIEPEHREQRVFMSGEMHVDDPAAVAVALQEAMDRGDIEKTEDALEYLQWLRARERQVR